MPGFGSLICLAVFGGIIAGVVCLIVFISKQANPPQNPPFYPPFQNPPTNMPGTYLVKGVDRNTRQDTSLRIQAESEANARVKADLAGIVVTSVQFEGPVV